jgi:hypothetical protein
MADPFSVGRCRPLLGRGINLLQIVQECSLSRRVPVMDEVWEVEGKGNATNHAHEQEYLVFCPHVRDSERLSSGTAAGARRGVQRCDSSFMQASK